MGLGQKSILDSVVQDNFSDNLTIWQRYEGSEEITKEVLIGKERDHRSGNSNFRGLIDMKEAMNETEKEWPLR